jgi:hypothetical protein
VQQQQPCRVRLPSVEGMVPWPAVHTDSMLFEASIIRAAQYAHDMHAAAVPSGFKQELPLGIKCTLHM